MSLSEEGFDDPPLFLESLLLSSFERLDSAIEGGASPLDSAAADDDDDDDAFD
jgi:hypothetical protein